MCPRSGRCVFWPLARSLADLCPRRIDEGLFGSPAVSSQAESPAGAAQEGETAHPHYFYRENSENVFFPQQHTVRRFNKFFFKGISFIKQANKKSCKA